MSRWLRWILPLLLQVPALLLGQVTPVDSTAIRRDSLLFQPGNPAQVNRDSLLSDINSRPGRDPFLDTTKLGTQPKALKRQGDDTVQPSREGGAPADTGKLRWPRPGVAARLSMVIPGAGQVYNRQIWKVPIVYGVLATTGYFYQFWNREYLNYKDIYANKIDTARRPAGWVDPLPNAPAEAVRSARNTARRYRDYNAFFFVLGWTFNALEAYVAAHLRHFTVSDNLALQISPSTMNSPYGFAGQNLPVPALQLRLTIH